MTSRVVSEGEGHPFPGKLKEIIVSCDQMSCDTALNDTEIKAGGGLKNMGWQTQLANGALRHYCPEHNRSEGVRD